MKTIAEELRSALQITRSVLAGASIENCQAAIALRAPLLESAAARKRAGEPWGAEEIRLAQELMSLDVQLIQMLWAPRAEAFAWLAERSQDYVAETPHLRQLAGM